MSKITIITPSYRLDNLIYLKNSINFDYVHEWIIVYDGSKIATNPHLFQQSNINEYIYCSEGISGNPQRNYAIDHISNPDTILYYLDDDNIIHPNLYKLLDVMDPSKMYTFNQCDRLKGNIISVKCIDTAMVLIPFKLCETQRWVLDKYEADGIYIQECFDRNKTEHVYVNQEMCYYNFLSQMNYITPTKFVNSSDYDHIVSIGNKCPTAMILRQMNIYQRSFPFDYIPTTPGLILKYLQSQNDFYPQKNVVRTMDGVWFGHFELNEEEYFNTIETLKRRFARLFDILEKKKKILFVYTSEADVYNEMNNRYNDNYSDLSKMVHYLIETYKYNNFKFLCIHTNKSYVDTDNITNYTIYVPSKYLSDDMSTHTGEIFTNYREILLQFMMKILI